MIPDRDKLLTSLYPSSQVFSGCAILTSYLFLFIAFYQRTYKNKSNVARSIRTAAPAEKQNSFGTANTTAFLAPSDMKKLPSTPQLEKAQI